MAAPLSLIDDPWLPVRRASGAADRIPPAVLAAAATGNDPVVRFDWRRPDLDAAACEFMIGLLSVACRARIVDDWAEWWAEPPDGDRLAADLAPWRQAFVLDGEGPRFLQDKDHLVGEPVPVAALLMDAPGAQTVRNNADLFVKRGRIGVLARPAAAMALFALQAFAPSGGAGHRTSLRGGGPLTTLVWPGATPSHSARAKGPETTLWHRLWCNVWWNEDWTDPEDESARLFPWLAATRGSANGETTTPEDAHPAQAFWGMPRRIRLVVRANEARLPCDLSGTVDDAIVDGFVTRPHGTNYAAWGLVHPLTPHYRTKVSDVAWLPVHPQPGRLGYRDWVGLVFGDAEGTAALRKPAAVIAAARNRLRRTAPGGEARLWAAGYDMDNMKARGFVDSEMPVHLLGDAATAALQAVARQFVAAARDGQALLANAVRSALWKNERNAPASDLGDRRLARDRFWEQTEAPFFAAIADLAATLDRPLDEDAQRLARHRAREGWRDRLRNAALAIFDDIVPPARIEALDAQRYIAARRYLTAGFAGLGKIGASLYSALGLTPPATPAQAKRRKA